MKILTKNWKQIIGVALSIFFMYLAFRNIDLRQMSKAFMLANYWYLIPAVIVFFISIWLRALRWQYLLETREFLTIRVLFPALLIGYMFNIFLPAHLGEFIRAYMVNKKKGIKTSTVFGSIVIERIIDVFTMLLLMALALVIFPFPQWVRNSGYLSFVGIVIFFIVLILMKKYRNRALNMVGKVIKFLPFNMTTKIISIFNSFFDGIVPLKKRKYYIFVTILSIVIWICYGSIFQLMFFSFDFVNIYSLPWSTALVILVITTISVLVPSSPGYIGTYHYLCQISLGLFGIPKGPALTFAFIMHGINTFPLLIVGVILILSMRINFIEIQKRVEIKTKPI